MITETLKEIEIARAKLAALESAHSGEIQKELAALPAKYGFESAKAFVKAVKAASGGRKPGKGKGKTGRTRATVTDEMRAEVKRSVAAEKTGAQIAKAIGVSVPTVQNIKKSLGLVAKRKK